MRAFIAVTSALAVGALTWGAISLERVFAEERSTAVDAERSLESALVRYASVVFAERLQSSLREREPEIQRAAVDPMLDDRDLFLLVAGEQILPRRFAFAPERTSEATAIYRALTHDPEAASGKVPSPWSERVRLLRALFAAIERRDDGRVVTAMRALLTHRSHHVLRADREITSTVVAIERLLAGAAPSPVLLAGVLVDGLEDGSGGRLEGLAPSLLAAREHLTETDFVFLAERLSAVMSAAADHVIPAETVASFRAQWRRPSGASVALPDSIPTPAVIDGRWFVDRDAVGRLIGVRVDFDAIADELGSAMQRSGLLGTDERLAVSLPDSAAAPLAEVEAAVMTGRWVQRVAEIDARYRLKVALGGVTILLAVAVVGLALMIGARQRRFVELKAEFVATVSHELRTPLASIRLMGETLERRLAGHEAARDYPSRIVREVDGLGFLVENILSFNRLDKGGFEVRPQSVDVRALVGDIVDDAQPSLQRRVELDTSDAQAVQADPELVRLLLSNLVRNAANYCEAETAKLVVTTDGQQVTVRDNGVGIESVALGGLFEPFVRPAGQASKGSGLGLAICRRIMEAHGGSIEVARTGPDGTTFVLQFG